jgi:hypothetical protein
MNKNKMLDNRQKTMMLALLDLCAFNATCGEESGRDVARHDFDRAYMEAERTLLPGRESLRDVVNRF